MLNIELEIMDTKVLYEPYIFVEENSTEVVRKRVHFEIAEEQLSSLIKLLETDMQFGQ